MSIIIVLQECIVDAFGKAEFETLLYHHNHQKEIRADLYNGVADAFQVDDGVSARALGVPVILPASFHGEARSMREKYQVSSPNFVSCLCGGKHRSMHELY